MQRFLREIEDLVGVFGNVKKKIVVVVGQQSYEKSGARDRLEPLLAGHSVVYLRTAGSNPQLSDVMSLVRQYEKNNPDIVIAVGGGSVIDTAKVLRLLAYRQPTSNLLVENSVSLTNLFVAIPTTAGSGAESTHFAVVYTGHEKHSLRHDDARADVVILDVKLMTSVPAHVAAASGIDAVAQAIESYWSVHSTRASRSLSKQALLVLLPNIERAVLQPTVSSRQAMLQGANLAGQAINLAFTTAPHAFAYGFTTNFGIAHGEAVALTLPYIMKFNAGVTESDCQDRRRREFVLKRISELAELCGEPDANGAATMLHNLRDRLGLRSTITVDDVPQTVQQLSERVNQERLKNNPRFVSPEMIRDILLQVIR